MRPFVVFLVVILIPVLARAQWTKLESGTTRNLNSVCLPMGSPVVVGDSGIILKLVNAQHWISIVSGTTSNLYSVAFGNYIDGYAVGSNGTILRTTDAGESWTAVNPGISNDLFSVCAYGSGTAYAVGSAGTILKTNDGGDTWVPQVSGLQAMDNLYSVHFISPDTGFAAGGGELFRNSRAVLLKTTDGGATWIKLFSDYSFYNYISLASVWVSAKRVGYAVGGHGTILQFSCEDSIVIQHNSGTATDLYSVCAGPDITGSLLGYAVGYQGTIRKNSGADSSWFELVSGTTMNLNSVCFFDYRHGFAVGDGGTILMTENGGGNGLDDQTKRTNPLHIFPNPSSTWVTVESNQSARGGFLTVYNPGGVLMLTSRIAGPETLINITPLPPGVYFVRVNSQNAVQMGKFIKQW